MEVHDDPDNALSDPATQLNLKDLEPILMQAKRLHEFMRREEDIEDVK
jgi:3-deoxy-D-manno-octulosonic acid (KDO) 8-phosphate synthase